MFCLLYSPKQKIVKFHAQKSHVIDIFTSGDMENISLCIFQYLTLYYIINALLSLARPNGLGTRERPGTSCKIEINFWLTITQYLIRCIIFLSQTCPIYSFPCARHRHKVSNSFTKESGHKLDFYSVASPSPFLIVKSPGVQTIIQKNVA